MDIESLRLAYASGVPVEYKAHCLKRMLERDISKDEVSYCILHGEMIEDYPLEESNSSEKSYPSCLLFSISIQSYDKFVHVVVGYNNKRIIIISVYRPDDEHWENDYKTRRKR